MGLGEAWKQLMAGHPGDAFSYALVPDDQIQAGRDADAKLAELNQQRLDAGIYDAETYATAQAHLQGGTMDDLLTNPDSSPLGGFESSLSDTVDTWSKGIQSATSWTLGSIFKLIPWQVWLLAAGYLLFLTSAAWLPLVKRRIK